VIGVCVDCNVPAQ
jgi:hypothetical protein